MRPPVLFPFRRRQALVSVSCAAALALCLLVAPGAARRAEAIGSAPIPPAPEIAPTDPAAPARPKPHPCTPEVKSELTTVIDAQLAAFRADDYTKAFTFAAGGIKEMFTQAEFEAMVRKAYPVIAHSTSVDYGMAFDTGEEAAIYVRVQNTATKADAQYQYLLKKEDGAWKIGGVSEVKPEGLSV